jgi:predicted nucleic acid-binding protein
VTRQDSYLRCSIGLALSPLGTLVFQASLWLNWNTALPRAHSPGKNREALEEFVSPLDVAGFDRDAAEAYGRIRDARERKGLRIGAMDMLIAAHALSFGANLVTNNETEFRRVAGLRVENWS